MLDFFIVLFAMYVILVLALAFGWARMSEQTQPKVSPHQFITIIVPFRDEAGNIGKIIEDLKRINYPEGRWEAILVNDHSGDGSEAEARSHLQSNEPIKVINLGKEWEGKKRSITAAINEARGEIIVTTDADCRLPVDWLTSIDAALVDQNIKMIVGPVRLAGTTFFSSMQEMEFFSLVGTAGATLGWGKPTLCNGANLAYRKKSFQEVEGFAGNDHISSGDDEFILRKFANAWKGSIRFLYDERAVVVAPALPGFAAFVRQRLRWAGKWRRSSGAALLLAPVVWAFHLCNLLLVVQWLNGSISTSWLIGLLVAKAFAEMILLFPVSRFLGRRWSWLSFLSLQSTHSLYVVIVGLLSQFLPTRWKGRKVAA